MYPGMSPEERTTFAPYSAFDVPADLRELHGRYDVEATARRLRARNRWAKRTASRWVSP